MRDREQLVDHLDRAVPTVVHRRDVGEEVVELGGLGLEPADDVQDLRRVHVDDLFVARDDGVTWYENIGDAQQVGFVAHEVPVHAQPESVPLMVSVSDIDRDGDGDLYLSMFVDFPHFVSATFNVPAHAKANVLLRNDGDLRFTDITTEASASKQNTFTSAFVDLDGDGLDDLVVAQNTGQAEILRNTSKRMENRALPGPIDLAQIPALAERGRKRLTHFFDVLDERLAGRDHLVSERFTFADISAYVVVDFARWVKIQPEEQHTNLRAWAERVARRDSVNA